MFIVTWLFNKLGFIPKIKVDVGVIEAWPFPPVSEDFEPKPAPTVKKKPVAKKVIVPKKPKVVAKTTRTKAK